MANLTACSTCGRCYEAESEEQANEPVRACQNCFTSKLRAEMLAEIDTVIQSTVYWQGGRLDTIKYLLARLEKTEAKVEQLRALLNRCSVPHRRRSGCSPIQNTNS